MEKQMIIPVLFGGRAPEHSSSIDSSSFPITFSDKKRYRIHPVYVKTDGKLATPRETAEKLIEHFETYKELLFMAEDRRPTEEELREMALFPPKSSPDQCLFVDNLLSGEYDVVFPIFHGQLGEDGQIQCLLDYSGIPYTGCSAVASVCSNDKEFMKHFYRQNGIPTCNYYGLFHEEWLENPQGVLDRLENGFPYPIFIKPPNLGSSIGVHKVRTREELEQAIGQAFCFSGRVLVEEGLEGREISLSVIGNGAPLISVPAEFVYKDADFFDYKAKYEDQCHSIIPAQLSLDVQAKLREYSRIIYEKMELSGMSRIDFFVSPEDEIHVLEINTTPSLYTDSTFVMVAEHHGISKHQLFDRLIELALERKKQEKQ